MCKRFHDDNEGTDEVVKSWFVSNSAGFYANGIKYQFQSFENYKEIGG